MILPDPSRQRALLGVRLGGITIGGAMEQAQWYVQSRANSPSTPQRAALDGLLEVLRQHQALHVHRGHVDLVGRDLQRRQHARRLVVDRLAVRQLVDRAAGAEGERREEFEWFNVVAWGNLAEICKQYLTKGSLVYIEGRLQTRHWDDPEGKKHYRTEIVANEMIMLSDKRDSGDEPFGEVSSAEEEDFPF